MKGSIGSSMQGIEIRKPKTFNGGKPVYCKECKHLVFNTENITMPSKVSTFKGKQRKKNQIYPYMCQVKHS